MVRGELQNKTVVQVAAGDHHSMCATEDGSVYTWGNNEQGQLGQEGVDGGDLPVLVCKPNPNHWCVRGSAMSDEV